MAILTHDELLSRIDKGEIQISPFNAEHVGPASIDFTLGTQFRVFKKNKQSIHLDSEDFDANEFSDVVTVEDQIVIHPQETFLGVTVEKLMLASNICGWLQGRSRFARIGLMVHITSNFIQPGISNHQVLEIFNAGPISIALHPGIAICQIIFEDTIGRAQYSGKYTHQTIP